MRKCVKRKQPRSSRYLRAGNVHSGGVESVLHLSCVVHLQNIVPTELDVVWQLAVLEEVHHECHLTNRSTCTIKTSHSLCNTSAADQTCWPTRSSDITLPFFRTQTASDSTQTAVWILKQTRTVTLISFRLLQAWRASKDTMRKLIMSHHGFKRQNRTSQHQWSIWPGDVN